MKINANKCLHAHYTESSQKNPLRWQIMYKEADDSYTPQTNIFRCRDFFNDLVAKYKGQDSCCYSLDTKTMKLNPEGVYVLLQEITNTDAFLHNLSVMESITKELPPLQIVESNVLLGQVLVFLPLEWFQSTWTVSMMTYLIRISHNPLEVGKNVDLSAFVMFLRAYDMPFGMYSEDILKQGVFPPNKDTWAYIGSSDPTDPLRSHTVHNCGCGTWYGIFKAIEE